MKRKALSDSPKKKTLNKSKHNYFLSGLYSSNFACSIGVVMIGEVQILRQSYFLSSLFPYSVLGP